eukprot:4967005-Prymnesium_polylepis.1
MCSRDLSSAGRRARSRRRSPRLSLAQKRGARTESPVLDERPSVPLGRHRVRLEHQRGRRRDEQREHEGSDAHRESGGLSQCAPWQSVGLQVCFHTIGLISRKRFHGNTSKQWLRRPLEGLPTADNVLRERGAHFRAALRPAAIPAHVGGGEQHLGFGADRGLHVGADAW